MSVKEDALRVTNDRQGVSVYISGDLVARYWPGEAGDHAEISSAEVVDLESRYDLEGSLVLDQDFFHRFFIPKHQGSKSDMVNVAKAFFSVPDEERNRACLVQYLPPDGASNEHYHTLEEHIVCLAGEVILTTRPTSDDTAITREVISPGGVSYIARHTSHVLQTTTGSLTVPIKQTIEGRKDHLYQIKSRARVGAEIDELVAVPRHESGDALLTDLQGYCASIHKGELYLVKQHLKQRLRTEGNGNIVNILTRLRSTI